MDHFKQMGLVFNGNLANDHALGRETLGLPGPTMRAWPLLLEHFGHGLHACSPAPGLRQQLAQGSVVGDGLGKGPGPLTEPHGAQTSLEHSLAHHRPLKVPLASLLAWDDLAWALALHEVEPLSLAGWLACDDLALALHEAALAGLMAWDLAVHEARPLALAGLLALALPLALHEAEPLALAGLLAWDDMALAGHEAQPWSLAHELHACQVHD